MSSPRSERTARVGLVVLGMLAVLLTTLGAGYRASDLVLGGSGAFLQRGHDVVHVNAESGTVDAETARALASGTERLDVVQVDAQKVYVVNTATGEVTLLPTDSLVPERVLAASDDGGGKVQVVTGGGVGYLVGPDGRSLFRLDDSGGRTEIALSGPVSDVVVDGSGTAWALSLEAGELYEVSSAGRVARHGLEAEAASGTRLSLVDDRPAVYDPTEGVVTIGVGATSTSLRLPPLSQPVEVASTATRALVSVVRGTAEVFVADLDTGDVEKTQLSGREGSRFGEPVVFGGRLYVPDFTLHDVVVLDLGTLDQEDRVAVPGTSQFSLFARDGKVWANDPYDAATVVFHRNGAHSLIDKGTGEEVDDGEHNRGPKEEPRPADQPEAPLAVSPPDLDTPSAPPATTHPPTRPPANHGGQPEQPPAQDGPGDDTTPTVETPNVVGQDKGAACDEIRAAGLKCALVVEPGSDQPTGTVVATDPEGGTMVQVRSTVRVYYAGFATAPNVVGWPHDQACAEIQARRLVCNAQQGAVAQTAGDVGKVYAQDPVGDSQVANGSTVTLLYHPDGASTVPPVTGKDPTTACADVQAAGFVCEPHADGLYKDAGIVQAQDPGPGVTASVGSPVRVYYQQTPAQLLYRYKAQGQESRLMGLGPQQTPWPADSWTDVGHAYPVGTTTVPGLITISRYKCDANCGDTPGRGPTWAFRRPWDGPPPDDRGGPWHSDGDAFACFDPRSAQPNGTLPLTVLYHPTRKAFGYAIRGSEGYNVLVNEGYGNQNGPGNEYTLCYTWA